MEMDRLISIGESIVQALTEMKIRDEIPMTRQQAAFYLGVSVSTIDNYIARGQLTKTVKHGIVGFLPTDLRKIKK